jgi:hypothetical protein
LKFELEFEFVSKTTFLIGSEFCGDFTTNQSIAPYPEINDREGKGAGTTVA